MAIQESRNLVLDFQSQTIRGTCGRYPMNLTIGTSPRLSATQSRPPNRLETGRDGQPGTQAAITTARGLREHQVPIRLEPNRLAPQDPCLATVRMNGNYNRASRPSRGRERPQATAEELRVGQRLLLCSLSHDHQQASQDVGQGARRKSCSGSSTCAWTEGAETCRRRSCSAGTRVQNVNINSWRRVIGTCSKDSRARRGQLRPRPMYAPLAASDLPSWTFINAVCSRSPLQVRM
jgi:hypothetical protein